MNSSRQTVFAAIQAGYATRAEIREHTNLRDVSVSSALKALLREGAIVRVSRIGNATLYGALDRSIVVNARSSRSQLISQEKDYAKLRASGMTALEARADLGISSYTARMLEGYYQAAGGQRTERGSAWAGRDGEYVAQVMAQGGFCAHREERYQRGAKIYGRLHPDLIWPVAA